jgi:Ribosomal L28e protein family
MKGWKTLPNEQASGDLIWDYTRNNNCYLVQNTGTVFSRDPLNLSGFNLKRDSGLASTQAVGIQLNHRQGRWREHKVKKSGEVAKFHLHIKTKKMNPRSNLRPVTKANPGVTLLYSTLRNQTLTRVVKTVTRGLTNYRRDLRSLLAQRIRRLNRVKRNGVKDYCDERRKTKKTE